MTAEKFLLPWRHALVFETTYEDRSDVFSDLVHEQSWQLHPCQKELFLNGSLITFMNPADGQGVVWFREAPTRFVRQWDTEALLSVRYVEGKWLAIPGLTAVDYDTHRISFSGGLAGRTKALHEWQSRRHPSSPKRDGLLLTNTWGDRSRADRLNEDFILQEIERAAAWGVEILQIDDGWQKGRTVNTSEDGVWNDFWSVADDYWSPDPKRFPRGLSHIIENAQLLGLQIGLWYAPDSSGDLQHWKRDAEVIIDLWKNLGVRHFKLDGVKLHTPLAEKRFRQLIYRLIDVSDEEILIDLDTTDENRLGFWGQVKGTAVFVENRYTDWGTYYPHSTLRALWMLSSTVSPRRLRMEFLNPFRNEESYDKDPLRPSKYTPDYLFASVMLSSPLGWFENTGLPQHMLETLVPLVSVWLQHRSRLHDAIVYPIGACPDGYSWTGFAIANHLETHVYLLLFRETTKDSSCTFEIPRTITIPRSWNALAGGDGSATSTDNLVNVSLSEERSFLFLEGLH